MEKFALVIKYKQKFKIENMNDIVIKSFVRYNNEINCFSVFVWMCVDRS